MRVGLRLPYVLVFFILLEYEEMVVTFFICTYLHKFLYQIIVLELSSL